MERVARSSSLMLRRRNVEGRVGTRALACWSSSVVVICESSRSWRRMQDMGRSQTDASLSLWLGVESHDPAALQLRTEAPP
eukprot:987315-Amphidinium_carterae.1